MTEKEMPTTWLSSTEWSHAHRTGRSLLKTYERVVADPKDCCNLCILDIACGSTENPVYGSWLQPWLSRWFAQQGASVIGLDIGTASAEDHMLYHHIQTDLRTFEWQRLTTETPFDIVVCNGLLGNTPSPTLMQLAPSEGDIQIWRKSIFANILGATDENSLIQIEYDHYRNKDGILMLLQYSITVTTYYISKTEVERRRKAYTALITFFLTGIVFSSADSAISRPLLVTTIYAALALLLPISRIYTFKFFDNFIQVTIHVQEKCLERAIGEATDNYDVKDITRVKVKRTSYGTIREIMITFNISKSVSLNGIKDFEKFEKEILNRLNLDVKIVRTREPINYDHIFFYPMFALLTSVLTTTSIRFLLKLEYFQLSFVYYEFLTYTILMSIYILLKKSIAESNGRKESKADYILGGGLLLLALGILLFISRN